MHSANNPEATTRTENITNTIDTVKKNLAAVQEIQATNYNKRHREVQFDIDDKVLLSTKNLKLAALELSLSRKFLPHFIRPFIITSKISPVTYKLDLSATMRIHS